MKEGTGSRDPWLAEWISTRRRLWSKALPFVDIDDMCQDEDFTSRTLPLEFAGIEHTYGSPRAFVDYKKHTTRPYIDFDYDYNLNALKITADALKLPFYIALYWKDYAAFQILTGNVYSRDFFEPDEILTEKMYVRRMFKLRGLVPNKEVIAGLKHELPQELIPAFKRQQRAKRRAKIA